MLDTDLLDSENSNTDGESAPAPRKRAPRKAAADGAAPRKRAPRKAAADPAAEAATPAGEEAPPAAKKAPAKKATRKAAAKKAAPDAPAAQPEPAPADAAPAAADAAQDVPAEPRPAKKAPAKRTRARAAAADAPSTEVTSTTDASSTTEAEPPAAAPAKTTRKRAAKKAATVAVDTAATPDADAVPAPPVLATPGVLFVAPAEEPAPRRRRAAKRAAGAPEATPAATLDAGEEDAEAALSDAAAAEPVEEADPEDVREAAIEQASGARRRRRRGRRGRGGGAARAGEGEAGDGSDDEDGAESADTDGPAAEDAATGDGGGEGGEGGTRRRRRRRRSGTGEDGGSDDPPNTVTHVREPKAADDGVKGVKGSTRLEAKRQRRRDGRETTRRRAPILTEAEFLARREAVDRVMAVRQSGDRTQIAVLEDEILVEHYVTRASATSYVGNVYLGRVQNVLPSMEAAFVDIGKGRNGVLYAGEVNWDAAGLEGKSRAIENALKSGDTVLVQVTKDPIGHKGARLTSQVSLPGRFLVYVPGGGMTGISRRLPDTERHRLKSILKKIVPEDAGVIVRTAAEGASEEDLTRDVERLTAQWAAIQAKSGQKKSAPVLVHGEPDLAIRVVRDVFNEDFNSLVVQGDGAWETVSEYVDGVAPDLAQRVRKHTGNSDLFHDLRVDEQLMKALDRKVWLPSGGSLVIDRTEAMTVIDVNTGKFVGAGGNLEQTVTRNNLEAAEEIVRQLRLRDVGGIVVIDFIDMVLESNRELVLRRLTECLGRDRTKHQVAEVTSLGLVQMTRKRVGEGLLEAFSETCEVCHGRGVILHAEPVDKSSGSGSGGDEDDRPQGKSGRRKRGARGAAAASEPELSATASQEQRRAANAAIAAIHRAAHGEEGDEDAAVADEPHDDRVDELASGLIDAARQLQIAQTSEAAPTGHAAESTGVAPTTDAEVANAEVANAAVAPASDAPELVGAGVGNGATPAPRRRRRAASRPAGPPAGN